MSFLLALARKIDALNERVGQAISWVLLLTVFICAGNALVRYTFHVSSNAWLEIQWYLFSAIFLLAAGYTLRRNEHVRIDVVVSRFSRRTQVWIDIVCFILFLLPVVALILVESTPYALESIRNQEMSSNAGGLIVWPVKLLIPVGFALLGLQAISELIKRVGYLRGLVDPSEFERQANDPRQEIEAIKNANQPAKPSEHA